MSDTTSIIEIDELTLRIVQAVTGRKRPEGIAHYVEQAFHAFAQAVSETESERQRPSVLFRPDVSLDGDHFSVLYGPNIMDGCAGFGKTVDLAMRDFDKNWVQRKAPNPIAHGGTGEAGENGNG